MTKVHSGINKTQKTRGHICKNDGLECRSRTVHPIDQMQAYIYNILLP